MGEAPSFKIVACPRCGAPQHEPNTHCAHCGSNLDLSGVGERATLPSHEPFRREQRQTEATEQPTEAGATNESAATSGEVKEPASGEVDVHPSGEVDKPASSDMSMAKGEWKLTDDFDKGGAAPDPLIGLVVAGRYRIMECIGRGGMGVVYRVEHTEIGKLLALKLLAGELSRQKDVVRRFKREALLASRLTHPNCVQVFDFGVSDGLTYLVMELVVGRDLSRLIKPKPMQSPRLAKIMVQVCSSLAEAHGMGIVHRDIKPENIVIAKTKNGSDFAKVLDFGLAKLRESSELNTVTGTGQVVGTPFYMAPEQIHGRPVDGRADIYALGAVMYEALTGEPTFRGSSPMAVFTKHLTQTPEPPSCRATNQMIPPTMDKIVLRCLEKSPDERYQQIEDLQRALVEHLGGQSGVDALLDPSGLHALQSDLLGTESGRTHGMSRTLLHREVATRDEVTAFKRKLARQRWLTAAVLFALLGGVAYGGKHAYERATAKPPFAGLEEEPNNQASEATRVPFGRSVRGMLGKRIDDNRSDRDFFRIEVPSGTEFVSVNASALPNMATCWSLYREGELEPRGRYCPGAPGKPLVIPMLRVQEGPHLFAVMQDRTPYDERGKPFVFENVSDAYELTVASATQDESTEVEPNDTATVATSAKVGETVTGYFAWVGDVDLVCVKASDSGDRVRLRVEDALERPRDLGAVLELAHLVNGRKMAALRVHRAGAQGKASDTDVIAPWNSKPFKIDGSEEHCLHLRLTGDPWAGNDAPMTPPVSGENWKVSVEKVE